MFSLRIDYSCCEHDRERWSKGWGCASLQTHCKTQNQVLESSKALSNAALRDEPWWGSVAVMLGICYLDIVSFWFNVHFGCSVPKCSVPKAFKFLFLGGLNLLMIWGRRGSLSWNKDVFCSLSLHKSCEPFSAGRERGGSVQRRAGSKAQGWFWLEWRWACHWCPVGCQSICTGLISSGVEFRPPTSVLNRLLSVPLGQTPGPGSTWGCCHHPCPQAAAVLSQEDAAVHVGHRYCLEKLSTQKGAL